MAYQPHKNPYQLALYLITRWPDHWHPQVETFAAKTLEIADPSSFVEAVYQLVLSFEDGSLKVREFVDAFDKLMATTLTPDKTAS